MSEPLFDVVEVPLSEPRTVRLMAEGKTRKNAEAIVMMAVMRRGVEDCFYAEVPAGRYHDGDVYTGGDE